MTNFGKNSAYVGFQTRSLIEAQARSTTNIPVVLDILSLSMEVPMIYAKCGLCIKAFPFICSPA